MRRDCPAVSGIEQRPMSQSRRTGPEAELPDQAPRSTEGVEVDRFEGDRRAIGVVVAHGALADGLVSAVRRIAGDAADLLRPVSNEGLSPQELCARIEDVAKGHSTVVFSDMGFGSCGMAARSCCLGRNRRVSVGGVNLPMLLDFVCKQGDGEQQERCRPGKLGRMMVECGRGAIALGSEH